MSSEILVFKDIDALSLKAAKIFVELSDMFINKNGRFSVAISGGSTPIKLFSLLSNEYRNDIDWERVHIFWADERCVPADNEESNYGNAYKEFISKVPLPNANIHRIKGEEDPVGEARRYEEEIINFFNTKDIPSFDLILLGLGEDGHTASLFPGSEALNERKRIAVPIFMKDKNASRITLTLQVLNNAKTVIFMVSGSAKSRILTEIIGNGRKKKLYPAGRVSPSSGSLIWLIDKKAAAGLRLKQIKVSWEQTWVL